VTTANVTTLNATTVIATTANVTTANITTGNVTNMTSGNVTITGGSINGTTLGATTASTANVTTLTTSSTVTINGGTANGVAYLNGSKVLTTGSALVFDGSNLGLGVTPSAWGTFTSVFQGVGYSLAGLSSGTNVQSALFCNAFFNGTNYIYRGSAAASQYLQIQGQHQWFTAASGTAGNTISFTQAMTLNASGQLIVGGTGAGNAIVTSNGGVGFEARDATQPFYQWYNSGAGTDLKYWRTGPNTSGDLQWQTVNDVYNSASNLMILSRSGNLGLGVTPSAWNSSQWSVFEGAYGGALAFYKASNVPVTVLTSNAFYDSSWKYKTTDPALQYEMDGNIGIHKWYTAPSGNAGDTISFTQAMTLDASGQLAIGTTSINEQLRINGSSNASARIRIQNQLTDIAFLGSALGISGSGNANDLMLSSASTNNLVFGTNTTERARITSDGDLLVGRTSYGGTATGIDLGRNGFVGSYSPDTTNSTTTFAAYSNGASAYRFYVGWGGTVFATNTTISAISDQRLKENVQDLDVGLDAVMALKPRKFDWKAGKGKDIKGDRGFIAQEFEQVFPDLIDEWKDPAPEGEEPYKSVRQDLIPVLVKAIQELKAQNEDLRARVAALESQA
jgi:hypothetical protein